MSKTSRLLLSLGTLGLASSLIHCGGSGSPTAPSAPVPTPAPAPVSNVISKGSSALGSKTVAPVTFTTTSVGTLDVTVDWTLAANDVDIFLARGTEPCTLATFNDRSCGFMATEESTTMKPEKLRVTNLAPGAYSLYVANYGSSDESIAWQFVLTTASGASVPSVTSSAVRRSAAKGPLRGILDPR